MPLQATRLLIPMLFGVLALSTGPTSAAIYLCTGDEIRGDVTAQGYENCIAIDTIQEGVALAITSVGGQREIRQPVFTDISLTKGMDKASIGLRKRAIDGTQGGDWVLHFTQTCEQSPAEYASITLARPVVSAMNSSATANERPTESFSLNFTRITYSHTEFGPDCSPANTQMFGWDLEANRPL